MKSFVILLVLFVCLSINETNAQVVEWVQKEDKGGTGIESASSFAIGNRGYIVGGFYGGRKKDFWEWDQSTNIWTQLTDFTGDARNTAVGFELNQKGYFGLGTVSSGVFLDDIWEWNPLNGIWTKKGFEQSIGKRTYSVSFVIDDEVFIGLGHIGSEIVKDFWKWNPSTNVWTKLPDFPGGARSRATAFAIGDNAYVGLGYYNNVVFSDFWKWDNILEEWSQMPNFEGGARDRATSFSIKGYGFVGLGHNGNNYKNDFWSFDPTIESWNKIDDLPADARSNASFFVINDKAYVGMGVTDGNITLTDLWELNVLSGSVNLESENRIEHDFKIYPNPIKEGVFYFDLGNGLNYESYVVKIADLTGKVIYTNEFIHFNTMKVYFDTDIPGIYIVQLLGKNEYQDIVNIGYTKIIKSQ